MTTITIKELHARTGEWVRKAGQTGEITVTDRGHPIAVIHPLIHSTNSGAQQPLPWRENLAKAERDSNSDIIPPVTNRLPGQKAGANPNPFVTRRLLPGFAALQERLTGGTDSTDIISEMRDGR